MPKSKIYSWTTLIKRLAIRSEIWYNLYIKLKELSQRTRNLPKRNGNLIKTLDLCSTLWYNIYIKLKERADRDICMGKQIMAKVNGMNTNYVEVTGVLNTFEGGKAFSREVYNAMVAAGSKRTFNSVNATLAAMAGKGYVTKVKGLFEPEAGDAKVLTIYTITELGAKAYADAIKVAESKKAEVDAKETEEVAE